MIPYPKENTDSYHLVDHANSIIHKEINKVVGKDVKKLSINFINERLSLKNFTRSKHVNKKGKHIICHRLKEIININQIKISKNRDLNEDVSRLDSERKSMISNSNAKKLTSLENWLNTGSLTKVCKPNTNTLPASINKLTALELWLNTGRMYSSAKICKGKNYL